MARGHHQRRRARYTTGTPLQPVERGDTAGVGQSRQPDIAEPQLEPVERVRAKQFARPVGYGLFRLGWSPVLPLRPRRGGWLCRLPGTRGRGPAGRERLPRPAPRKFGALSPRQGGGPGRRRRPAGCEGCQHQTGLRLRMDWRNQEPAPKRASALTSEAMVRAAVDLAIIGVMADGGLRRSEAATLAWGAWNSGWTGRPASRS